MHMVNIHIIDIVRQSHAHIRIIDIIRQSHAHIRRSERREQPKFKIASAMMTNGLTLIIARQNPMQDQIVENAIKYFNSSAHGRNIETNKSVYTIITGVCKDASGQNSICKRTQMPPSSLEAFLYIPTYSSRSLHTFIYGNEYQTG